MTINFDKQVVIVTGAGGGLGRAHAMEFARRGAKIIVNDIGAVVDGAGQSQTAAQKVVEEIEALGGEAIADSTDITDDDAVVALADSALERFGRIDVLVNNAGILRDKSFLKMTNEDFDAVIAVHLTGAARLTKAVWPAMREQSYGRIIVTTSSTGLYGNFGQANYGAAKLGLVGLINTLKLEGAKYDIRCNALAPVAYTRMTQGLLPDGADDAFMPEYVSPAVIYLASKNAPNGVVLGAGGGVYSVIEITESQGLSLGTDARAEDIETHWQEISDMKNFQNFENGGEQTLKFFQMTKNADDD